MYEVILSKLEELRVEKGITILAIAKKTGLSNTLVNNYLHIKKRRIFSKEKVQAIADALESGIEVPSVYVQCAQCSNKFEPLRGNHKFCSDKCRDKYYCKHSDIYEWRARHSKPKPVVQKPRPQISIAQMNQGARDHGMSYGKWEIYLQTHPEEADEWFDSLQKQKKRK